MLTAARGGKMEVSRVVSTFKYAAEAIAAHHKTALPSVASHCFFWNTVILLYVPAFSSRLKESFPIGVR